MPGAGREKTEREWDDEMLEEERKPDNEVNIDDEGEDAHSDEEEDLDLPHCSGGINRLCVCPHNSDVVGVWGDAGVVSLYDISGALDVLEATARTADRGALPNTCT